MTEQQSKKNRIDYKQFRNSQLNPLIEWNELQSFGENLEMIINQSIILPHADIQAPVIAAYGALPSAMASILPILYIYGEKGSGKSNISLLLAGIHNCEILSSASTFAAVRNETNKLRWNGGSGEDDEEKNYLLVFDNINEKTLDDEKLYSIFLNGYNRKTDRMIISKGNGENLVFRVFGPKIVSTIHPLFLDSRYQELNRRCIFVRCKQFEKMNSNEKSASYLIDNINERLDVESFDIGVVKKQYDELWKSEQNLLHYVSLKRELTSRKKSFTLPKIFSGERWTICVDLIVSGVCSGVWSDYYLAIDCLTEYWKWCEENILHNTNSMVVLLRDYIADQTASMEKINRELGYEAVKPEINPQKIKAFLACSASQGLLEVTPTPNNTAKTMRELGWHLQKNEFNNMMWMRIK